MSSSFERIYRKQALVGLLTPVEIWIFELKSVSILTEKKIFFELLISIFSTLKGENQ